jgi:hypothetical protein
MMGKRVRRPPRSARSIGLAVLAVSVVSCGRLGLDQLFDPDADLVNEHPDASANPDSTASLDSAAGPDSGGPDSGGPEGSGDGGPGSDGEPSDEGAQDGPQGDDASACSPVCSNPHGTTGCVNSTCVPVCSAGFADCDGDPSNGCETSTTTTSNCGTCGHVCPSDAGAAACTGGTCGVTCDLSGTWAAKLSVQLSWASSLTLAAGSGTLQFWVIVKGMQNGNSVPVTMVPCEIAVPDFESSAVAGNEPYGVTFSNTLFDHTPQFLPTTSATVTLGGSSPGSTYTMPTIAFLLGASMTNPTTDPWPATPAAVTEVDMDQDGHVGVTQPYKTGGSYDLVPLDIMKSQRADENYLAARLVASFTGTLSSCTNMAGSANVTNFDTHIIGCDISGDAGACSTTQSNFVDSNRPAYTVTSASISLVKVASTAVCSDVRAAL